MKNSSIDDVKLIKLPVFKDLKGDLIPIETNTHIPIEVKRVFQIIAPKGSTRGEHSHKAHSQFMLCTKGEVLIECDDGKNKKRFTLNKPNIGIFVPPNIWSNQKYTIDNSILTVLCDAIYNENEYVRDYNQFLMSKDANSF
tara:strand:+ start:582 stop:1004 length:423 start_codon:yes stop_codon:yes gene_type:complete